MKNNNNAVRTSRMHVTTCTCKSVKELKKSEIKFETNYIARRWLPNRRRRSDNSSVNILNRQYKKESSLLSNTDSRKSTIARQSQKQRLNMKSDSFTSMKRRLRSSKS